MQTGRRPSRSAVSSRRSIRPRSEETVPAVRSGKVAAPTDESWFTEPVDVRELIRALEVTEDGLLPTVLDQPAMLKKTADFRMQQLRELNRVRAQYAMARRDTELSVRVSAKHGEDKVTESHVKARVDSNANVMALEVAVTAAEERDQAAQLLMEAMRARGSAAKTLVNLLGVLVAFGGKQLAEKQATAVLNKLYEEVTEKYGPGYQHD